MGYGKGHTQWRKTLPSWSISCGKARGGSHQTSCYSKLWRRYSIYEERKDWYSRWWGWVGWYGFEIVSQYFDTWYISIFWINSWLAKIIHFFFFFYQKPWDLYCNNVLGMTNGTLKKLIIWSIKKVGKNKLQSVKFTKWHHFTVMQSLDPGKDNT